MEDRTYKVFFNASKCDKLESEDEKLFFKYLRGERADNDFTRKLNEKVALIKKNTFWRNQYMTWEQTIKEERKEAKEETAIATAKNFLKETALPPEQIARCCNLPLEQILALKEEVLAMQN